MEWAHAVAPGAQIVLVEANSQSLSDLMASVSTAANQPGVSVVSMSWGFHEGLAVVAQDEALYDSVLTTPAGHQGVTFVASTGDYGAADPEYPAFSPNVVAVGGTSLYLNGDNSYSSESGWGYNSDAVGAFIGGGGGVSQYEAEPVYQTGVQSTGYRTTPDVAFVADPATGVWVADPFNLGLDNPFEVVGGTSVSAPSWAGLFALADQGRAAAGEASLGSAGDPTASQEALYSMPASDYNAVTTGNNGYEAGAGYNLVTGLGTPAANLLIPGLIAYQGPIDFTAGGTAVPTVTSATVAAALTGFAGSNSTTGAFNVFDALTVPSHAGDLGCDSATGDFTASVVGGASLLQAATSAAGEAAAASAPSIKGSAIATSPTGAVLRNGLNADLAGVNCRYVSVTTSPLQAGGLPIIIQTFTETSNSGMSVSAGHRSALTFEAVDAVFVESDYLSVQSLPSVGVLVDRIAPAAFHEFLPPVPTAETSLGSSLPCDDYFTTCPNDPLVGDGQAILPSSADETVSGAAIFAAGLAALLQGERGERIERFSKRNRGSLWS